MTRSDIEEFADQTYRLEIGHLLTQKAERRSQAIANATRTGNRGVYLPALCSAESENVAAIIRARTDAYLEAFARCGLAPDFEAEKALSKFTMQVVGGANSSLHGELVLHSQRTRQPLDPNIHLCQVEIKKSGHAVLNEGILRLRRQRTACRLQGGVPAPFGSGSSLGRVIPDPACQKKKRGRPQTIPEARKLRALELKASGTTNKGVAAELYGYTLSRQSPGAKCPLDSPALRKEA